MIGETGGHLSREMAQQVRDREAELLGKPARLPTIERESVAEAVRAATGRLRSGVVRDTVELPLEAIPEIMFTLHPFSDLWNKVMDLSIQMQSETGLLAPRDRQLAILRTAWLLQAPYEWGEHVRHSKKVGITSEEIERVVTGSGADGWNAHERAILRTTEELRADAMVSDATWEQLADRLDHAQLFELLVLIGQFTNVAYFQNALRLRLEPNNPGLAAR